MSNQKHTPDSLAQRLDEVLPPDELTQAAADHDPLVDAAAQLANAPRPTLAPDVMARIQAQVLEAQRQQMAQTPQQPARVIRLHPALRWALVASFVVVVLFAASIPPTMASVPGDALYPVKQAFENVELTLATSPQAQAAAYLNFAERRTSEFETLLERGTLDSHLVDAALNNMILAADRARSGDVDVEQVQARTLDITVQLNSALHTAAVANPSDNLDQIVRAAQATQASGDLLLPAPPQPTPTDEPAERPAASATPEPTMLPTEPNPTALPAPSSTPETPATEIPVTATATESPSATASLTPVNLPVNLVIEGPIEAIIGNIIIIYGIEVEVPADDPLLAVLQIGDVIRIDGSIQATITQTGPGGTSGVNIETVDVDTAINPDNSGEVWRDSGDCSNPPPPWAPANGWRARCGGQASPGNSGGNNGNNNGGNNNGNNGRGNQGQGRGNNDDDDD